MTIEYIPPKPHCDITFQALEFYVSQIPAGQVLTEKKLMAYLRNLYGDDCLDVDEASVPYAVYRNKDVPFWRYLSPTGLVQEDHFLTSDEDYARKLAAEGHSILLIAKSVTKSATTKSTRFLLFAARGRISMAAIRLRITKRPWQIRQSFA